MGRVTNISRARFGVGDLVHPRLFGYRGGVVDVDPRFQLTEAWYETVARSRPRKNRPWHPVLVHDALPTNCVVERDLQPDPSAMPIEHPLVDQVFSRFENGRYVREDHGN